MTCLNCPDRCVEPNCHTNCTRDAEQRARNELIRQNRNADNVYDAYAYPKIISNAVAKAAR